MSGLSQRITTLSQEQLADLVQRLRKKTQQEAVEEPICPRAHGAEPAPLSFAQQRLWFLAQLEPGSPAYNMPIALRLTGALDPAALAAALGEVVARHEVLRTTFAVQGDDPMQRIAPAGPPGAWPLPLIDLQGLEGSPRQAEAERLGREEAAWPFDLERGPLMRACLLRRDASTHDLLLTMHHIASDGWSIGVLIREVAALYPAFATRRPSPLAPPPVQYADFAIWQRKWLAGALLDSQLAFWRGHLAGAPPALDLPTDFPRTGVSGWGGIQNELLSPGLCAVLKALGRQCQGATLFMTLLAAWTVVLSRYSGMDDLVVGSPVANRNHAELEGLIGCFVNTLALRIGTADDPGFLELLARVRETALAAYANQDLPFEKLVAELAPERRQDRAPLFQAMLVYQNTQNTPAGALTLPGLTLELLESAGAKAKLDLTLFATESADGLAVALTFDSALFERATAQRMAGCFRRLLESAATDPALRLSDLSLLGGEELTQLLVEWNGPAAAAGDGLCVHERFEHWVDRTPDAMAVVVEQDALSYAEVESWANRLARRLRRLGVGPEVPVALGVDRSLEMIVGLLAILKAGGSYVPLDPDLPEERLAFVLADSGARVLLARRGRPGLPSSPGVPAEWVDRDNPALAAEQDLRPVSGAGPEQRVYTIYTSGSTGRPKGVAVEHRQLTSYVDAVLERLALPPGASYATVSTIAADLGNTVVFASLMTGGTLHVISGPRLTDPEGLAEHFERTPVDCLKIVPSHLAALLEARRPERLLPRKTLVLGGEGSRWSFVGRLRELSPGCRILNHYGPTETTVGVLTYEAGSAPAERRGAGLPLGRPLRGTRIFLLDRALRPVPAGAPGELYVGGSNVSRGYVGRPGLTAERFVPDPFPGGEPGARLYRTGDRARHLPGGLLEFLGRADDQVKIRGHRVEPGEVAAALRLLPGVRDAVVLAHGGADARLLVAFVVPENGGEAPAARMRGALRERLPEAMLPAVWLSLPALPLTPNGKIDRRALVRLADGAAAEAPLAGETAAPRTPVEEVVAAVWADLLGRDRIGIHESFFDLGGHSLLATQAISRLRAAFGVELPLRSLFERPTVAGAAAAIEAFSRGGAPAGPPIVGVPRAAWAAGLPLSFAQQRLWFLHQLEPGSPAYNIPLALRLSGLLSRAALAMSLGEIVARHEALRTTFHEAEGLPAQRISPASAEPWPLALIDLEGLPAPLRDREAGHLQAAEALRPFDLARGPLLRVLLLRLSEGEHTALCTLHHIASDGWSTGVLIQELTALYGAFSAGRPSPLGPLPVQYADFALWQREWLRGEVLERQIAFWRESLAGAPPVLELPSDRPRPTVRSGRGGTVPVLLPPGLMTALLALARRQHATLFMVLLAAWKSLLARLSGETDLVIGSPIANRHRRETEGLIGFFVNTLALRTTVPLEEPFGPLVSRVRESTILASMHQDLPFERLVEELAPGRDLAVTPLFQVMLVFQSAPRGELRLPGLTLMPLDVHSGTAKLDLTLLLNTDGAGTLEYSLDLFDGATMERLLGHFRALLGAIISTPERLLGELPLLSAAERLQLLAWAAPAGETPPEGLVHHLFAEQVRTRPDAVALVVDGRPRTYRELAAEAHRLAHTLRRLGVGPDDAVGVCVDPPAEVVVPLLAVLQAGGAFLPLDPTYPPDRLGFMVRDAGARLVLTQERLAARLPEGARRLLLDAEADGHAGESDGALEDAGGPESLAYIIYTSGTTGRPKGVPITHCNLLPMMLWGIRCFGLDERTRVLQNLSYGFDFGLFEILTTLCSGGALHFPGGAHGDFVRQAAYIAEHGIDTLHTTPSFFREVLAAGAPVGGLRIAHLGGEPLTRELVAQIFTAAGEGSAIRVFNGYGPTEVTVNSSIFEVTREEAARGGGAVLPIGRPTAANAIHLLDPWWGLVPVGIPGELCVGGPGVARGYLARPGLTAGKFIPDPFGAPGGRLYRTGDLARWLPTGDVEFLGRIDQQVKIRGYRIELEEIEAVLRACPGVREAAVAVRADGAGGPRLAAYLVTAAGEDLTAGAVRAFAESRLPAYMVPAAMVFLAALPLTASGKVDRRALPEPDLSRPELHRPCVALRTPTEEVVAAVWSEVLGIEGIGARDNFFELGGHSLLATRITSRVRAVFGVDLPLRHLFESPTVAALSAFVEALLRSAGEVPAAPPLVRTRREGPLPLSFAQQRLWFLDRLQGESTAYHIPFALELAGRLDLAALAHCLDEIVRRHEALRTTFREGEDGEPVQVISPAAAAGLAVIDLAALSPEARQAEARRLRGDEARHPFRLDRDPLLRARLLRLAAEEHQICLTFHHIASDGWSTGVLARELSALYSAFRAGRPSPLPDLPFQYGDYAVWQRDWLRGEVLAVQLGYWRDQLGGVWPSLDLPTDRPRRQGTSLASAVQRFVLPEDLAGALRRLGRQRSATLFMTLLATFQALLARLTGQDVVVVGSPVANRGRGEIEDLIGFFVNTVALRTDLSGDPSFGVLLDRAREVSLGAQTHQDLPFERLVEEMAGGQDRGGAPLQVLFALQNVSIPPLELPGLAVRPLESRRGVAKSELTLALIESGGEILGSLEHCPALLDAPTVARWTEQLKTLAEEAVSRPDRRLSELSPLARTERQQLLVEWNDSRSSYPRERCVHELFAEQARRTPEAVAVEMGEERLTYGELDRRANRLARRLRRHGAGPEVPVALAAGRSLEMIVGLLAILKSGGYYLPLDPQAPPERQALLLAEAGSPVPLSEALAGDWLAEEDGDPGVAADPDQLAYVMYTSGSTGRPKGVSVSHRAIVRLVQGNDFAELAGEVFLQLAPLAFDASTLEIWGALLNGSRLVVMPAGTPTLEELGSVLRRHGVTTLWLTAGLFHQMVESRLEDLAGLRQLLAGGDVLSVPHVRRVRERFPGLRLINGYGPTEGTTFTCCHTIGEEWGHRGLDASVPVGRPIRNTWIHVLSRDGQLQPAGAPGELVLGGDGLARGYLARPDLTAEAFVPDPFGPPGARCYRTRDRARRLADGTVEFLGRLDHQVKIRGFRIEPGEIEAALLGHPGVREAAVVVRESGGDKRLAAFVALVPEGAPGIAELREQLRGSLPEYMVPSTFAVVDALPLGATGKVDRRALERWSGLEAQTAAGAGPRTPVEELLASLFAEVLGVERVGIEDGFFELGGHSLLATRLISRARAVLGIELPLRDLFEAQTVAALASRVEEILGAGRPLAPPLARAGRDGLLPLSFGQERLWFLDRLQPDSPAYNIPFALELAGRLDAGALERSLGEITRRHEVLRTVFREVEGQPVPVILPLAEVDLAVADLSGLPAEVRPLEAQRLRGEEARRPFALDQGPLLRVRLYRLGTEEHQVCASLHHIIGDGWSVGLFVRELGALYAAALSGEPSPLRALPVQYADFAIWQRRWLAGETLEGELAYWRERLAGLPPVLELPIDRPRPAVRAARGAVRPLALPGELAESLAGLGRAHGATLFMVLLAAYQALLLRYSGQDDLAVGTPVAGRRHLETEPLIGLFINTLVLRGDLAGDPGFSDLLARAREATLGAFAHADVPFEKIVEALQPKRSLSHTPLFQVLLQLQSALIGRLELPGLALTPLGTDTGIARFDLTLTLEERDGALQGSLAYDRDLFDAATIDRLGAHLGSFLAAVAADPESRLSAISFLSPAERQQLLREWSDTAEAIPGGPCVHRWIEARARRTPDATALVFAEHGWSYRQLDEAANRLARDLRGQGIGPESLVAVCVERSAEMVLAVLAVLKAGGAYLPLDPAHPRERLASILADAGWPLLVTQESLLADLPDGWGRAVRLDADAQRIARWSGEPLELQDEGGEGLAYVIYTSGSTGKPKGVQVPRRGLANFLGTMRDRAFLTAEDTLVAVTTLSFDIAGLELLLPLITGARLVVASREVAGDGERLAGLLAASGATALQATPATWRQLLEAGWIPPRGFRALCGGEALPGELAGRLLQDGADLWNLYGPTETTVWSSVERVVAADSAVVPLGRPLGNTALHLLDRDGHPVALGAAGEVCIGGAGVARGYLNRPELTAERFVPDPFAAEPGSRLYRTGDLARRLADGRLEFLGRLDHQVKIRGFRIELGEIEGALAQHPAVRQGVVTARRDPGGDPRLVAYVVAAEAVPTISELRRFLRQTLPDYMLPASLVVLERMPLNASGKVDRRALPAPSADRPALASAYEAPRTGLETIISGIWSELLPVGQIGVDDNFFDLGGHSLLLLRLRGRLRELCGVELPLLDLFEHPTVGALARRIAEPGDTAMSLKAVERTAQTAQGKERMQQRLALRRSASPEV